MSITDVRVIKANKPSCGGAELKYGYVDLQSGISNFYIPIPEAIPPQRLTQIHFNHPPPFSTATTKNPSCARRFCAGICNFFNRTKISEDENDPIISTYQQLPATTTVLPDLYYPQGQSMRPLTYSPANRCSSRTGGDMPATVPSYPPLDYSFCEKDPNSDGEDEGEFIIYIPKASRTKLERSYLEPLRKGSFDPIVIQAPHSQRSAGRINPKVVKGEKQRRPLSKFQQKGSTIDGGDSEETLGECLVRVGKLINESEKANGDYCIVADKEPELNYIKCAEDDKSKTRMYLYIPISQSRKEPARFILPEKKISWGAIHERHNRTARNVQRMLQERAEKWRTFFAIWGRRRLVGERKKRLASDHISMACTPPNMLESRFHHIHWLGNSEKCNNSVGRYFDKEENSVVALKIFSAKPYKTVLENLDNKLMAIQEISSLKKMGHKNIVKLLAYFEHQDKYHLILESCDHSLRTDIEEAPSGLGTGISKKIIRNVIQGLHFCHQANCLHRDLCPENILVCKDGSVKIADFDRSVFISDDGVGGTCPTPGSYAYNSPEILAGDKEYGLPSDIWSVGIIFCELLTGEPPWDGRNMHSQLREIHNCVGPLLPRHASIAKLQQVDEQAQHSLHNHVHLQEMLNTLSASCCSFIKKCLDVNPHSRFTCGELIHHPFMKGNYK